jgi:serine/threonine protein phosphatase 1
MGATELDHPDWINWDHANEHGLDPASDSLLAADRRKMQCLSHLDWIAALPLFIKAPHDHIFSRGHSPERCNG